MNTKKGEPRKSKILIADDNSDMVFLLKKGLGQDDYHFLVASDGEETLRKVKAEKPDLLLLDLKMPRKSGLEVIGELRDSFDFRDLPVIVLTVVDNPVEKIKALELGASDFLVKPPAPEELKARVNTQLQLHKISTIFKRYSEHLETVVSRKARELKDFAGRLEEMVEEKVGVIKRQNEELMVSLRSAQKIQKSFLPTDFPRVKGLSFSAFYQALEAVGGDIYNVFRVDEDTIGLFIADVSGHGIPSAMITIFMKQEVLYHSKQVHAEGGYTVTSPSEVLAKVNRSFVQNNIGEGVYFVTAVYCVYSLKKRELRLSIAGHHALPILKRKNGETKALRIEGFPIGWFEDADGYTERSLTLEPGDSILFYTDGLIELCQEGKSPDSGGEDETMIDDMTRSVSRLFEKEDIDEQVRRLVAEFERKGKRLNDDLTLLRMIII